MAAEGGGDGGGGGGGGVVGGNEIVGTSPKSRVKLLCSHGGKILPRPTDGALKYVGGETRVVAFSREINFSELMKKLTSLFEGELVLKYQLMPEDLDALVSVKSDEDLRHMLDEYERQEAGEAVPRLRAFLFPSAPILLDHPPIATDSREQRYIDAVNGVIRHRPPLKIIPPRPTFHISASTGTSPHSPADQFSHDPNTTATTTAASHECPSPSVPLGPRGLLHKVRSSPSLPCLSQQSPDAPHPPLSPAPQYNKHPHHYHQSHQQYHHHHHQLQHHPHPGIQSAAGGARMPLTSPYYSSARQQQHHKVFGSSNKYVHMEEGIPPTRLDNPHVIWE